jgi:hypothetical protein
MKRVFSIITVAAIVLAGLVGCGQHEQTATEILTGTNGWVLSAGFSNPPCHLSDGSYASDLINDEYLKNFEVSYILVFTPSGDEIVKPGSIVAPSEEEGFTKETKLGTWKFDNPDNPTTILMYIPFLYDEGPITCQILDLAKDDFRISCIVQDDEEDPAKKPCTFTLTFVPAK